MKILQFAIEEGIVRYDEITSPNFKLSDFDEPKFRRFLERVNITVNLPLEELLVNLGLADYSSDRLFFKNVAVLFFAKNLKRFHPSAFTTCLLYRGNDRTYIIDRKDFEEGLLEQLEGTMQFIERNTLLAYQIKSLKRKEISQYPIDVVREAVVNAIVHRDYFERGSNIFVHIYQDFIEIINPGGLFKINPERFGKVSSRRNEKIAELFRMLGMIEKAGTGIIRMQNSMLKHGLKEPEFEFDENFFIITLKGYPRERLGRIAEGKEVVELNDRQKRMVEYIEREGRITLKEAIQLTKRSRATIKRDLHNLILRGFVQLKGRGAGAYYEIERNGSSAHNGSNGSL